MAPLTLEALGDLPGACRSCLAWELEPVAAARAVEGGDAALDKEAWLSEVLLAWGSAGRLAYVDDALAGFLTYAPPVYVPRSMAFPTSPVSADAVLLMSGRVLPAHRGGGIGRMLVQGAARELTQRGVRAVEAFALADGADATVGTVGTTSRTTERRAPGVPAGSPSGSCLVPAGFLEAVGFKPVRPHHRYPRLRLELRTALAWREDVEAALERILGTVHAPALTGTR